MTEQDFKSATLEAFLLRLCNTCESLEAKLSNQSTKEVPAWCTLAQAAELKGGTTAKNLQKRKWQQPCCGTQYSVLNGTRVWNRAQIMRWLEVTDPTLEDYATECGVDISAYFRNGKTVTSKEA